MEESTLILKLNSVPVVCISLKGYTDEPLSRILMHIDEGSVVQLDR